MKRIVTILISAMIATSGSAQQAPQQGTDAFTSENAILDTAIPFAIGAREAQQNLRGSFGWPSFQEGLVEGVYFRFDPDGYARFSPSPRLDTDVFEVICRPRTYTCMGRKDGLNLVLTNRGQIQLKFEGLLQGDQIYVSDGLSEIQMPERILAPLELQFETLLAAGGEVIAKRGNDVLHQVSLTGFGAVSSYLRWITARQDYTVLPRNWPVPNSDGGVADGTITHAMNWASPMPQPQAIQNVGSGIQYAQQPSQIADINQVRDEIALLRDLLAQRSNPAATGVPMTPQTMPQTMPQTVVQIQPQGGQQNMPQNMGLYSAEPAQSAGRLTQLEQTTQLLLQELITMRRADGAQTPVVANETVTDMAPAPEPQATPNAQQTPANMMEQALDADPTPMPANALPQEVAHLSYLVSEMGLDPKTALVLLQFVKPEALPINDPNAQPPLQRSYHDTLAQTILDDLEKDLIANSEMPEEGERLLTTKDKIKDLTRELAETGAVGLSIPQEQAQALGFGLSMGTQTSTETSQRAQPDPVQTQAALPDEYQPLSSYFRSVLTNTASE